MKMPVIGGARKNPIPEASQSGAVPPYVEHGALSIINLKISLIFAQQIGWSVNICKVMQSYCIKYT